ncbi:MAG: hypothetical protein ACJ8AT_00225 [Hyalangium sp.]|uniref:hypothetical protein n=1 Tax=Hyalangium sp. TaxID=2028555 RepID=UPI00389A071B
MTTPPDDDKDEGTTEGTALFTARHDELIRQMLQEKRSKLSPEEWRRWQERMLAWMTQTVIVPIPGTEGDGERG